MFVSAQLVVVLVCYSMGFYVLATFTTIQRMGTGLQLVYTDLWKLYSAAALRDNAPCYHITAQTSPALS